jgi:ankyrin repeat protein
MLLNNANINLNQTSNRGSALHGATEIGAGPAAKALLETDGINVNLKDAQERTPLHVAADRGHVNNLKLLLARRTRGL